MSNKCIKSILVLSVIVLILFAGRAFAQTKDWNELADNVNRDQDMSMADTAEMEKFIKMDKSELQAEIKKLEAEDKATERELERLENRFSALRKKEEQLKKDLADEQDEIDAIEGTVRATAKDALSRSYENPITAEYPERKEVLQTIIDSRGFPGFGSIKTLVNFYFQEMKEMGNIERRSGDFVGPDGRAASGEIVRIGRFTTYYRMPDGKVGFLKPENDGRRLLAVTGEVDGGLLKQIGHYMDKKSDIAPFDFSGGNYFIQLTRKETYRETLNKGGSIMYVILAVGIFAILLGIERVIVLGTKAKASEKVMAHIKDMASQGNWQEAKAFCSSKSRIPTCQMLDSAIEHVGHAQEVLENALQEAILRQVPKLERFLPTLALLAVISPLLGLLGTVTGMIKTFEIITQVGTSDATKLAGGISEALLTTQFGLVVAIPIMLVHHFLKSQVDKIVNDMQEKGTAFAITMIKQTAEKEA